MLNKKNIAKAMAAATLLSTAAPTMVAFADIVENTQTEEVKAVKEKVFKMMNLKFTKDVNLLKNNSGATSVAGKNVFVVKLGTVTYTNYSEFVKAFDKAYAKLEEGQKIEVSYEYANKNASDAYIGYNELEDGTIVDFIETTYTEKELSELATIDATGATAGTTKIGEVQYKENADGSKKYEVRLSDENGMRRFQELKAGDVKLALDNTTVGNVKPVLRQSEGYYVDKTGTALVEVDPTVESKLALDGEQNVSTIHKNAVIDGFYVAVGEAAETPRLIKDVVTKKGFIEATVNASEMFNVEEGRLTREGNEIVRKINALEKAYEAGVTYDVTVNETTEDKELTVIINKTEAGSTVKLAEVKVARDEADNKGKAFKAVKELLKESVFSDKTMVAAGEDRYQTAVEVSRMGWTGTAGSVLTGNGTEKAVVLVSGDSEKLVDGLAATPLAAALNDGTEGAPILLTKKDSVPQEVIDEMLRLGANKVYIVGGKSSVSDEVANTLKTTHGMKVERIYGDDKYETALNVADKLATITGDAADKVFIVGGSGMADALSVAGEAAKLKAPILLTSATKLNKDVEYFLKDDSKVEVNNTDDVADVYVIGGTSSVSEAVYNKVLDAHPVNSNHDVVKRLSGLTRQDTNAAIIKEFHGTTDATEVIVAKSNNAGLVDALGAGVLAAKMEAPVVLATDSLTEKQEEVLKDSTTIVTNQDDTTLNKVQVGYGIAAAVAKFIKGL